jgi:ubiquinone/menaquinone biosynthesis C-methylase UbiE
MNRTVTNAIRYVLDELLPPVLRDARWFMYPFFYIWYKGHTKEIKTYMDFKSIAYDMTEEEFTEVYRNLDCMARDRPTDLSTPSINYMLTQLDPTAESLMDVGCGNGFWLNAVGEHNKKLKLTGCDLYDKVELKNADYVKGSVYKLPFPDNAFDIVSCHHVIEHLRELPDAIKELKRVARKQLVIVTPRQRYYYYTMDMHLNFYPIASYLQKAIQIQDNICKDIQGDWVYIGKLNK